MNAETTARYMDIAVPEEVAFRRIVRVAADRLSTLSVESAVRQLAPKTKHRAELIARYVSHCHQRSQLPPILPPAASTAAHPHPVVAGAGSPSPARRVPSTLALTDGAERRASITASTSRSVASSVVTEELIAEIRRKAELALVERRQRERPDDASNGAAGDETRRFILSWEEAPSKYVSAAASQRQSVQWEAPAARVPVDPERVNVGVDAASFSDDESDLESFYAQQAATGAL